MYTLKITKFILVILLFSTNAVQATVYYVAISIGNDTYSGSEAQPWKTIQKAANTLTAGDTVYIKAGTYTPTEKIEFLNSGTVDNYINYLAYPGDEHLVIIDGVDIALPNWYGVFAIISKEYINISGLKVINSSYAGFYIDLSSNISIENNQTYQTKSSGISVWDSELIVVDNNSVSRACWPTGGEQECISIVTSNQVLVQNNQVFDGGSIGFGGGGEGIDLKNGCTNSIVYHNSIHGVASVGIYIDAFENNQSNIQVLDNNVYNISGVGIATVSEFGGALENIIISKNTVYNCDDRCMVIHWTAKPDYVIKNIFIQHNTFYNNGEGLDIGAHTLGENITINNNIFSQNLVYQMQYSSEDIDTNELHVFNNLLDGENPSWALSGENFMIDNPLFIATSSSNFQLQSTSPAIDQAMFLSKTISAGTGTVLELENVGFFSNGYGIKDGDSIKFEGQEQQFEILNIDYSNNTITIDEATTWNTADGVSLTYQGATPDIGAFEYDDALSSSSSVINDYALYPNPTKDILNISDKYLNYDYQITSISGKIVQKGILYSEKINLRKIYSGIYFLSIYDAKLNNRVVIKFIKNN